MDSTCPFSAAGRIFNKKKRTFVEEENFQFSFSVFSFPWYHMGLLFIFRGHLGESFFSFFFRDRFLFCTSSLIAEQKEMCVEIWLPARDVASVSIEAHHSSSSGIFILDAQSLAAFSILVLSLGAHVAVWVEISPSVYTRTLASAFSFRRA